MAEHRCSESVRREKLHVLVAEDDAASRRRLERMLQKWGYEVVTARDGREAVELHRTRRPQIALLDWLMPELDGVDVCREIRRTPEGEHVQVILISSRCERSDVVEALESGADGHLAKPWTNEELRAHLTVAERILRRRATPEGRPGDPEAAQGVGLPDGVLGMCSYCRRVRTPEDRWVSLERYLYEHSAIRFSHGICPGCFPAARAQLVGDGER